MELKLRVVNVDGSEYYPSTYRDIDRSNLQFFDLLNNKGELLYRVHIDDKRKRLIFRRRTMLRSDGSSSYLYLVGWQMTVRGEAVQTIMYIMPDGKVFFSSGWNEPYGKPVLYDIERKVIEN